MVNHPDALWVRVVKSVHGDEAGMDTKGYQTNALHAKIVGTINYFQFQWLNPFGFVPFQGG